MKKILLLTSAPDDGEDAATRNLREALEHLAPGTARIDIFHGFSGAKSWPGFSAGNLRDSLRDALRRLQPDVVVAAAAFFGILIDEIYQGGRARDFTLIALAADHDRAWSRAGADFFIVAGEAGADALAGAGVPGDKIKVLGFPVRFSPAGKKAPVRSAQNATRVLYLVNCARKKAPKFLDRLLEHPWKITVCVEPELEEMARERAGAAPDRLEVIGPDHDLPALLRSHQIVISRPATAIVQEAIAARCPLIAPKIGSDREKANLALLKRAHAGVLAEKPREAADWLERAFADGGKLLALWRKNLEPLGRPDGTLDLARFVLRQASLELRALPPPPAPRLRPAPRGLLLCDLHTHTTWSDGKLTIPELVDFYGQRGFDCLCVTDHLCDPNRLLGKLVNLSGLVIPPGRLDDYFAAIEREKKRAWAKYDLLLMAGVEFNKDGYTARTSAHLLGVDLKQPIDPSLDLKSLIREIHAQGALAIASHPHEMKSEWGRDTLYLWEHVDEYAPLLDAWEVANRDDIFNPVGLKKLPFIASSDFHKPKHIHSWKTLLYCEKEAEAIKHCIRVNRDVSLTLYRDHRFGWEEEPLEAPGLAEKRG